MNALATPPDLTEGLDKCSGCPIRNRAVCSYSSPAELVALDAAKFYRDYEPGQEIVGEGQPTAFVGSVVSGVVALYKLLEDGRRQMVGLLFASDFIGRPMRSLAPFDAVAITPVRMCQFKRSQFEVLLAESRSLERRLLEMTLDELDASRAWMLLLGRKTAREKLASFLLMLARRTAALGNNPMRPGMQVQNPLTRETIADFLGLTIETVSRQFTNLKSEGVLDLPSRQDVILRDPAELMRLAGEDDLDESDLASA
ncbi:MAG: transcriptional regulator FnrL [Paracoccaceae bacterium]